MTIPWREVNAEEAERVAELVGLEPARERRKYACPLHGGSDSLHAYPGPGAGFYCFSCHEALSNVDLAAVVWGLEPQDACQRLATALGIRVLAAPVPAGRHRRPYTARGRTRAARTARTSRRTGNGRERGSQTADSEADALQELREGGVVPSTPAELYGALLSGLHLTDRGRRYLAGRGFDPDAAAGYGFRAVDGPEGWQELRRELGESYVAAEIAAAGLHRLPFGGRAPALVLPYVHQGEAVGLRFRRLDSGQPKYWTLSGRQPPLPFNADALEGVEGEELHVSEGELNAYALHACGLRAIGLPGAGAWQEEWTPRVAKAGRVVAWYDADAAGEKGRGKLAAALQAALGSGWLEQYGRAVKLPPARDACNLLTEGELHGLAERKPWSS